MGRGAGFTCAELNQSLRAFAVVAFAGLCACGFIIGTFIAFANKPGLG